MNPIKSSFCQHYSMKTGLVKITNTFLVTKPKRHILIPVSSVFERHSSVLTIPYLKHYGRNIMAETSFMAAQKTNTIFFIMMKMFSVQDLPLTSRLPYPAAVLTSHLSCSTDISNLPKLNVWALPPQISSSPSLPICIIPLNI